MKKCLILFMMIIISSVALWAEYTGVGTFEKIDEVADIESGSYYVFYGIDGTGTGAMTNIAGSASNTLANTDVTLADGNFVDPDASVVWLVTETATGEYTVYNEAVSKYAEITLGNNKGCKLNANSSHTYTVSVHATYGFIFLCSSGAGVNRHLSIYLDQDWRSYTSATMKKLHLYKLTGGSTTTVATPTFDPIAGTYYQTKNVTISSATTGATIYYTTNGDTPTTSSTQYSAAISITATTTVKALAVKDGYTQATAEAAYVITDAPTVTTDLFFSEYIEGSSNNKAIEIYNGTGVDVVLTDNYSVKLASNANNFGTPFNLTGTLVNGEVLVIANSQADGVVLAVDHIINGATAYNGDDAIGLYKNSILIDIIGVEGSNSKQDVAGVTDATENHTLVRKPTVTQGNTNWTASAGTSAEDSEWIVYDEDTFDYLGFHVFTGGDTNTPPTIANIVQLPETNIISTSEILVTADVTDSDGTISEVKLHWGTSSESLTNTIDMTLDSGDTYWVDEEIPAQLNNTTVYYQITAKDNDGAESTSVILDYTVLNLKADFIADRTTVSVGQTVTFTSTTTGGVKPYIDYVWGFGDDTEDSIELSPTHRYSAIGTYTVTLLVGDTTEELDSIEKVDYIHVTAAAVDPAVGTLYISEVSAGKGTNTNYMELYNNSSDVLSLDKTKLLMLKADGTTESTFNLNNLSYDGDRVILPHNYIIITRGGDRETFETEFDSPLPEGVSFLKGSTGMYFGASTARRWQLVLDTGSKEVITIDDTKDVVGGSNKTSYQDSPGHWTTVPSANSTPGAPHLDQTLPVTLSSFMAVQTAENYAKITWTTESESSLTGYNVFRNVIKDQDTATRVNSSLIVAENSSQGSSYSYVDDQVMVNTTYYYWLQINEFDGSASFHGPYRIRIEDNNNQSVVIPLKTTLRSVYPNPFNPSTSVSFYMEHAENIKINIYNIKGQLITNLIHDSFAKGFHNVMWNGKDTNGNDCASGVYFFRMETRSDVQTIKGILMK